MRTRLMPALVVVAVVGIFAAGASSVSASPSAAGSSTAFSYSGTLDQANGSYDFKFQVFDALTQGTSVAGPAIVTGVHVTSKKYSATIDLGTDPFSGDARYLQISWRVSGTTTFTKLSPRVELVAVPYALGLRLPASESAAAPGDALHISNTAGGNALVGDSTGNGGGNGVFGSTDGGNAGVWGTNSGSGIGVYGGATSNGLADVYGIASGSTAGVWGTSSSGDGVRGSSSGAGGVFGENTSSGPGVEGNGRGGGPGGLFETSGAASPAIELASGGIKVDGAGLDTPTPAFVHTVTDTNTCVGGDMAILNNPFLNGHPNAIVFIPGVKTGLVTAVQPVYNWGAADCPSGAWEVYHFNPKGIQFWHAGDSFNVLVIDP